MQLDSTAAATYAPPQTSTAAASDYLLAQLRQLTVIGAPETITYGPDVWAEARRIKVNDGADRAARARRGRMLAKNWRGDAS